MLGVQFSSTGLVVDARGLIADALGFIDAVLRGVGQVMLQNNAYAGLLFLAGVFYNSTLFGAGVLVGAATSTATARLLAVETSQLRAGLFGFNGALVAVGLPHGVAVESVVTASTVVEGLFSGVAQVFFQASPVTGGLFIAGLLVSSRPAAAAALAGSLIGLSVACGMGAAEPAIRSGAFGFNSVLTAIALASVFFRPSVASLIYAGLATMATTVVFAAVSAALAPVGMPAMTLPFVLVVWAFVLAAPLFPRLERIET